MTGLIVACPDPSSSWIGSRSIKSAERPKASEVVEKENTKKAETEYTPLGCTILLAFTIEPRLKNP